MEGLRRGVFQECLRAERGEVSRSFVPTWKRSKGRNTLRDSLLRIMRVLWECELGHCCIVRDCLYNQ